MLNRVLIFLSIFVCYGNTVINAQDTDKTIAQKIDIYLNNSIANGFNGALLVEKNGEIIVNNGYGMANKEEDILNSSNTVFDIGSNTKQFTGAAILKLMEQNKLEVSDPLHKFFDDLPEDKRNITIHQLLTHTGGFQESLYSDFEHISTDVFFRNVFNSQLYKKPGTQFNYSNLGYSILARIIELTSGLEYEKFLQKNLFRPAGMKHTGYLLPNWNVKELASGYNRNILNQGTIIGRYQEEGEVSWNLKGNGGINSTQNDLFLWKQAINENKILTKSSTELWTKPYVIEINHYYGYGWGVYNQEDKVIYHNGGNGAFAHTIIWNWAKDILIIYATNAASSKVENIAFEIEKMILDKEYVPKEIQKNPYFFVFDFIQHHESQESHKMLKQIKEKYSSDFEKPEVLNRLGYVIMNSDMESNWAIEIFKMNTVLFPKESNVWDSLGDGYLAAQQKEQAIKSFNKAIELGNEDTARKLEEIQNNK